MSLVLVGKEAGLPVVSALDDVYWKLGRLKAGFAWHKRDYITELLPLLMGSVPEVSLVHQSRTRPRRHRKLATRIQRRTIEERTRRTDARRLRKATGRKDDYSYPRTLNTTATHSGGTSGADEQTTKRLLIEVGARASEDGQPLWGLVERNPLPSIKQ